MTTTPTDLPDWYQQLCEFFPVEELKCRAHLESLLSNPDQNHYHLLQTPEFILIYVNHPGLNFIHIDYLYVLPAMRRQGIGSKIINMLKDQYPNHLIILEAETEDCPEDREMIAKRLLFYQQHGFQCGRSIAYERIHVITKLPIHLNIHFYVPNTGLTHQDSVVDPEYSAFLAFKWVYQNIHSHRSIEWYGVDYEPVEQVTWWRKSND